MTLEELLKEVASKLDKLDIPYAITGGIGSSFYGQPRTTHDFDIVVNLLTGKNKTKQIFNSFIKDYYVSEEAIIDSVVHRTMFNIIHHNTGIKIDCWILKDDAYNMESFARRKKETFAGKQIYFLTPEDLILSKLLWYKVSESERQLKDVRGILEIRKDELDLKYLKKWAIKLKIDAILADVLPS